MKHVLYLMLGGTLLLAACESKPDSTDEPTEYTDAFGPSPLVFDSRQYDFGTIQQGESVTHVFKFKNNGDKPVIIENAQASCGCTVPEKPEGPVGPGETGEIKVTFNSAGKVGAQNKTITMTTNLEHGNEVIRLIGNVEAPETPAE